MKSVLSLGLLLSVATLSGCAEDIEDDNTVTTGGTDNTLVGSTDTTGTAGSDCEPGFKIGRCPRDIALPNSDGELVSLHDQRGSRVAVIGSAEY